MKLPNAEDLPCWKSGQSSPDAWLEKTVSEIKRAKGQIRQQMWGTDAASQREAFLILFEVAGDLFQLVWPVLPSKTGNERAARIQAATLMYHDVKAKCVTARVFGARSAFFQHYLLPDGRRASALEGDELLTALPSPNAQKRLT